MGVKQRKDLLGASRVCFMLMRVISNNMESVELIIQVSKLE